MEAMTPRQKFKFWFGRDHIVTPVIHVREDTKEMIANVEIAREAGADAVWLISHGHLTGYEVLAFQQIAIKTTAWDMIGVNLLDLSTPAALSALYCGFGLWTDNIAIGTSGARLDKDRLHFGGVAFKYQPKVDNLALAVQEAIPIVDVITTSGPATGKAASLDKIKAMREAAGEHPIAIASGVNVDNVASYLPYANAFLVASSIALNDNFYRLDPQKTADLVGAARG